MSSLIAKIGREYKSVVNRDDEIVDMLVKAAQELLTRLTFRLHKYKKSMETTQLKTHIPALMICRFRSDNGY